MLGAYKKERLRRHNEHDSSGRVFWYKYEFCVFFD